MKKKTGFTFAVAQRWLLGGYWGVRTALSILCNMAILWPWYGRFELENTKKRQYGFWEPNQPRFGVRCAPPKAAVGV
jgi:hypothetical protein